WKWRGGFIQRVVVVVASLDAEAIGKGARPVHGKSLASDPYIEAGKDSGQKRRQRVQDRPARGRGHRRMPIQLLARDGVSNRGAACVDARRYRLDVDYFLHALRLERQREGGIHASLELQRAYPNSRKPRRVDQQSVCSWRKKRDIE